jgi:Tfp pilus assembly protein FimT
VTSGKRPRRLEGGFTILELLVVIFIMLAMTGIAVAAFRQFLDTERIKLAGGQVVSALRMARQYAMSKRGRVMVEFTSPSPTEEHHVTLTAVEQCFVRGGTWSANPNPDGDIFCKNDTDPDVDRMGLTRFDLSSVTGSIVQATLVVNVSTASGQPLDIAVRELPEDTWTQGVVTWDIITPQFGPTISTFTVNVNGPQIYEVDVTAYIVAEAAGDKLASIAFASLTEANKYIKVGSNCSLKITWEETVHTEEEVAVLPRGVRVIPYVRSRNQTTGGFTWLLDADESALRYFELPRNVIYVLYPARTAVDQYDPADLDDHVTPAKKVWFDLLPDGTCVARAPDIEGWTSRINTLILRDAVTGDVALLFVPPSSSFTRQRYLFGDEVESFVAAYSLYSLW